MGRGNKTNEMDSEGKDGKQLAKFFLENWMNWEAYSGNREFMRMRIKILDWELFIYI